MEFNSDDITIENNGIIFNKNIPPAFLALKVIKELGYTNISYGCYDGEDKFYHFMASHVQWQHCAQHPNNRIVIAIKHFASPRLGSFSIQLNLYNSEEIHKCTDHVTVEKAISSFIKKHCLSPEEMVVKDIIE